MNAKLVERCKRFLEKPVENRKEGMRERESLQTATMAYLDRREKGKKEYIGGVSFYQ